MNFNTTNNAFMQDKVFLEDYLNIVEKCNPKCIKDYQQANLTVKEQQCLEKCYFKSLNLSQEISNRFGDIMTEIQD
jgi:hypothetical protein